MKKIIVIALAVVLILTIALSSSVFAWSYCWWETESLTMTHYVYPCDTGEHPCGPYCDESGACGPCSGVSIGRYYRGEYDDLPDDDEEMYNVLYEEFPTLDCFTDPFYYGYGFLEMTIDPDQNNNTNNGYYNFGYVYDDDVTADDYWVIVDAIDNGWPIAISGHWGDVPAVSGGNGKWPPSGGLGHMIAIRGYKYYKCYYYGVTTYNHRIICTDSYCESDDLVLAWDTVVEEGSNLEINIIKDEIPEDFEWGSDGQNLDTNPPPGEVDWIVTKDGNSVAEIETYDPHSGTRCAKFYYDGDPNGYNYVRGYYTEDAPIWRGFWFKTDGNTVAYTRTGKGNYNIFVRVLNDDDDDGDVELQYYDGSWHDTNDELDIDKWYFIEFRAIKWNTTHKYSIYIDGVYASGGRPMCQSGAYSGQTVYYAANYEGSFWIDDIPSSWW